MHKRTWLPSFAGALDPLRRYLARLFAPGLFRRAAETGKADQDMAARLRQMREDLEQATVRLGIIGESGSGKSSLINAIVGRPVAAVGALIETTQEPQDIPVDGLTLVDLPGCGTPTWPRDSYISRLKLLESFDGFILVTAHRLKECDALLFDQLARKANKPFFVVRSHFDLAIAAHGKLESRRVIPPHIRKQLGARDALPVYLVSSVGQEHYDLERLILDVRRSLPGWKQVRFMLAAQACGEETLARKREAAEQVIGVYAGLAALNALNPIPGLDVSVDLGLLMKMSRHIITAYGLRPEQIHALTGQARTRTVAYKAVHEVADRFAPYLTEKVIVSALRRAGMEVMLKSSSKWLPFVGPAISAGVGYRLAHHFGEKLLAQCESAAREVATIRFQEEQLAT